MISGGATVAIVQDIWPLYLHAASIPQLRSPGWSFPLSGRHDSVVPIFMSCSFAGRSILSRNHSQLEEQNVGYANSPPPAEPTTTPSRRQPHPSNPNSASSSPGPCPSRASPVFVSVFTFAFAFTFASSLSFLWARSSPRASSANCRAAWSPRTERGVKGRSRPPSGGE